MSFCSKCGTEVAEGVNFCGKCGYALNNVQSPSQTNYTASVGSGSTPFVMERNVLIRIIANGGLLLVIFGFFMPMVAISGIISSYGVSGSEIADFLMKNRNNFTFSGSDDKTVFGLLMILMFITAIVGVIIGIVLLTNRNVSTDIDWITIAVCIASGLIVYFGCLKDEIAGLLSGAYMIIIGWIIALVGQIISSTANMGEASVAATPKTAYWKKWEKEDWILWIVVLPISVGLFFLSQNKEWLIASVLAVVMMIFHRKRVLVKDFARKKLKNNKL